ncbi:MAG: methyltransferase domain-containing protein [Planctomycetes bacterium]|nr:methyltransferase domain-containing protein [Planctomycetota bacterium]
MTTILPPVPTTWQLLEADDDERRRFADLAAALRVPNEPAAPPNRLRRVLRLVQDGRTWFLKIFEHTQFKNRLHFAFSAPRARDDAAREAAVTQALRAGGIEAPRPVAIGRDGPRSYYLCAPLPGAPLAELLAQGRVDDRIARAVAEFCGDVLRRGFLLPDLSADHVFVRRELAFFHLGVLDLHNGTVQEPGVPPLAVAIRLLRRFLRSIRALPVPYDRALRFAVRVLRTAGLGEQTRTAMHRLPTLFTATRYDRGGKSGEYAERNSARSERELALLRSVWPGRDGELVLDSPCGAGRLLPMLQGHGHRVLQADASFSMLQETRRHGVAAAPALLADALRLPFADRSVAGVVLFRFLHHLPDDLAEEAIAEACRIADRFVVLSFFHPCSTHHWQRRLRDLLARRASRRFALTLGTVAAICRAHGLALHAHAAEFAFVKDLWVAAFVRG